MMHSSRRRLAGMLSNASLGVLASICTAVATAFAVRLLGVDEWGRAAAMLGIAQLSGAFLSFGTPVERVRRYARLRSDDARLTALSDTLARVGLAAIVAVVGLVVGTMSSLVGATIVAATGVFLSLGAPNYFASQQRLVAAGVLVLLDKSMFLACILLLGGVGFSGTTVLGALAFGGWSAGLVGLVTIAGPRALARQRVHLSDLVRQYKGTLHVGVASLAPSALLLDTAIVIGASGAVQGGLFGVGARVVSPMAAVVSAVVVVLLPFYSIPENRYSWRRPPRIVFAAVLVAVAGVAVLARVAGWWVPLLFGAEFIGAVPGVQLYLFNIVMVVFTRSLATILQAWDDDKFVSVAVASQVATSLVGIWLGAVIGGATGASVSLVATNGVLALVLALRVRSLVQRGDGDSTPA